MKRTFLFLAAALMVSPAFAAGDLCDANLQKIDDSLKTETNNTTLDQRIGALRDKAAQEQAAGDTKACISTTTEALTMLEKQKSGGGNSGGTSN
ncbi:hypothetical protein D9M68_375810 [compost metagenome]